MVGDSNRITPLEPSFHHTALVILSVLATILVADMDLNPRDVVARMGKRILDYTDDPGLQRFVLPDIVVGVYLNLHSGRISMRSRTMPQVTRRPVMI